MSGYYRFQDSTDTFVPAPDDVDELAEDLYTEQTIRSIAEQGDEAGFPANMIAAAAAFEVQA